LALYQILYWQNIPSQVKAWDDFDEVKVELSPKFIAKIDLSAKEQGLTNEDDYLSQWRWSTEENLPGTPEEVVQVIRKELETKFNMK